MIEDTVTVKTIPKTNFARVVENFENYVPTVVYNLMSTTLHNKKKINTIFAEFSNVLELY